MLSQYRLILFFILFLAFTVGLNTSIFAQNPSFNENINSYKVNFPAGTIFKAILQYKISTELNNPEDKVYLIVPDDINIGKIICIPKNSKFIGKIIDLKKAQIGQNGYFNIVIETLQFPNDKEISILGHIWTKENTGKIGGEFTERTKYRKVPYYIEGIGIIVQLVPDGPRQMGKETQQLSGSEWIIVLDKELNLDIAKD
ncbi:MAG: hypothetical protein V2B14_05490 [bacterium]